MKKNKKTLLIVIASFALLAALYVGYRIWGFGGMIIAPILTVTARELCRSQN